MVDQSIPSDESIADAKAKAQRDAETQATLERGARMAAESVERRKRAGRSPTVISEIQSRVMKELDHAPRVDGKLVRIAPDDHPQLETAREILRRAMISAKFQATTLDAYEARTAKQSAALATVRAWLERAMKGEGGMLALIGPQGVGKSHLLYGAGNALLDADCKLYGRAWYRLADELRYGGKHPVTNRDIEPAGVRSALWSYPIVLLDEVRATASTAFDDTEFAKFAAFAYDNKIAVVMTTNVWPLENVIGPAAASRFVQVGVDGPDRRQPPVNVPLVGRDLATGEHREGAE
jgi:hypothetical protein